MKNGNDKDSTEWNYKEWYAEHKKEISDKRKKRYQEDPDYKQKVLDQNRKYREEKAKETASIPKPRVRIPRHRKPVTMTIAIGGSMVTKQLVHIGTFSRAIGRSVPTIHQWERMRVIPRTPFVLVGANKQERLYSAEMIKVVRDVLEKRNGQVSVADSSFYKDIYDGWKAIGVDADAQVEIGASDVA